MVDAATAGSPTCDVRFLAGATIGAFYSAQVIPGRGHVRATLAGMGGNEHATGAVRLAIQRGNP